MQRPPRPPEGPSDAPVNKESAGPGFRCRVAPGHVRDNLSRKITPRAQCARILYSTMYTWYRMKQDERIGHVVQES